MRTGIDILIKDGIMSIPVPYAPEREYALGRKRTDFLVTWSHPGGVQKVVLELKILYGPLETALEKGLRQTWEYMDHCNTDEGHLVIFERDPGKSWENTGYFIEKMNTGARG